jgi:hypothetical protein
MVSWVAGMSVVAFDGTQVVLSEERWHHIVFRHPELKGKLELVLNVVANPDEAYVDEGGGVHVLKRLVGEVSDFLVVIYFVEGQRGYIRTAYYTSNTRKTRRYRTFRKLRLS